MKNALIFVFCTTFSLNCKFVSNVQPVSYVLDISIVQNSFSSIDYYLYKIANCNLFIYSCSPRNDSLININCLYKQKINYRDIDDLNKFVIKNLYKIEQEHVIGLMGGYYDWKIYLTDFIYTNHTKYIHVQNKNVPPIDSFFMLINKMIHKRELKIPRIYTDYR